MGKDILLVQVKEYFKTSRHLLMMQVIAIEDPKLFSTTKYHRSNKKMFKTYDPDYFEEEDTIEEEVNGDVGVENMETEESPSLEKDTQKKKQENNFLEKNNETELRTSLNSDTSKKRKENKDQLKDFLKKNFFLVIVGGCLAGIFLLIIVVSILLYLRGKLCKKTRVEDEESEDAPSPIMTSDRSLSLDSF